MITEFDRAYARVAGDVLHGRSVRNERTGEMISATHGVSIRQEGIPLLTLRDVNPRWACAEAVWFMYGSDDTKFLERFGFKAWSKFADRFGSVDSATGNRWRFATDTDQLAWAITTLREDPTSRQVYLNSWDPSMDCWNGKGPRPSNVPCLPGWHFWIDGVPDSAEQVLNVSVFQRSCDIWYGLPADIAVISLVQLMLARHLEVGQGGIFLAISNAHVYEKQRRPLMEVLARFDVEAVKYGGSQLNLRPALKHDVLPDAMSGEEWVVEELWQMIAPFYDRAKQPAIAGGGMAL